MNRNVLLIEPNYKNKYPPMGLMKISTYYKMLGDNVTFFKGDLKEFVLNNIYGDIVDKLYQFKNDVLWENYKKNIISYLKSGDKYDISQEVFLDKEITELLEDYRKYFYNKEYFIYNKKWDIICITTLFTFYWKITVETINFAKQLCKNIDNVKVGGIAASLLPEKIEEETGIKPIVSALNKAGMLGDDNEIIIDILPLDYSILYEIEYEYPASNAFYGYMTRGCVNKCAFCAVPKLEPDYIDYIPINKGIKDTMAKYGDKRNLLLLDNNILASKKINKIVDDIKSIGFYKGSKFLEENQYELAIKNLQAGINDIGYMRFIVKLYHMLLKSHKTDDIQAIYKMLHDKNLLKYDTVKKENILEIHKEIKPYFESHYKRKRPKERVVDFNQGIDARLISFDNMKKLSEIPIKPVRIAFDKWSMKDKYENAVRTAVKAGHKNLSNYILYNYNDTPIELYQRLELNVKLCEELQVTIYSFPMKYHPIQDEKYFKNRDYLGKHWNRKFIRAIQAILNSTKGKVGRGSSFFYKAFGKTIDEYEKLLYMPETLIIYRLFYEQNGITEEWWTKFNDLKKNDKENVKKIIEQNNFININNVSNNHSVLDVLSYYLIKRSDIK